MADVKILFKHKLLCKDKHPGKCPTQGPQEYSSESDKETFWHNIHVEVERAKLASENLLLIGDFNAKLGRTFIPGDIHDLSMNGNQLLNL